MPPKCPRGTLSTETSAGAGARWVTRLVPCFLLLLVAYATYVVVERICRTSALPLYSPIRLDHRLPLEPR